MVNTPMLTGHESNISQLKVCQSTCDTSFFSKFQGWRAAVGLLSPSTFTKYNAIYRACTHMQNKLYSSEVECSTFYKMDPEEFTSTSYNLSHICLQFQQLICQFPFRIESRQQGVPNTFACFTKFGKLIH